MAKTYRTELEIVGVNKNDAYYSYRKEIIGQTFFEDFGAEIEIGERFNMRPSNGIGGKTFHSIKVEVLNVNYTDAKAYGDKGNDEWQTGVEQRLDDLESKFDSLESDVSDKAEQSGLEDVKGDLEDLKTRHDL